jgi:hypothetical protein
MRSKSIALCCLVGVLCVVILLIACAGGGNGAAGAIQTSVPTPTPTPTPTPAPVSAGQWTWVGGSNSVSLSPYGVSGSYGTLDVPAAGNLPGSHYDSAGWTGAGNFWLFGGSVGCQYCGLFAINDLWEFSPTSRMWTWMGGGETPDEFGFNYPSARYGPASWKDNNGNFWLLGGMGMIVNGDTLLNDLWEYSPATGTWMFVSGGTTVSGTVGVYGTEGVPSTTNVPGGRQYPTGWADASGNFWIFGGDIWGSSSISSPMNDLWEFSPSAKTWAWMSGSNTEDATGTYGTQGVPSTTNTPGARRGAFSWTDRAGNFWLFGGLAIVDSTQYFFNDLWKFNPTDKTWTWMSGSNTTNASGNYGTRGVPSMTNVPQARAHGSSGIDPSGNLWLFGGSSAAGVLNDVWMFNPSTETWTWVSGADTADETANYGALGISSSSNIPGARWGSTGWIDDSGNFWLFGGYGCDSTSTNFGMLNDLWVWHP